MKISLHGDDIRTALRKALVMWLLVRLEALAPKLLEVFTNLVEVVAIGAVAVSWAIAQHWAEVGLPIDMPEGLVFADGRGGAPAREGGSPASGEGAPATGLTMAFRLALRSRLRMSMGPRVRLSTWGSAAMGSSPMSRPRR